LVTFLEHTEAYRRDFAGAWNTATSAIRKCGSSSKNRADETTSKKSRSHVRDCGKEDPRCPVSIQQIADALKKQGTPAWLLIAKDEGHGSGKSRTRFSVLCDGGVLAGVFAEIK